MTEKRKKSCTAVFTLILTVALALTAAFGVGAGVRAANGKSGKTVAGTDFTNMCGHMSPQNAGATPLADGKTKISMKNEFGSTRIAYGGLQGTQSEAYGVDLSAFEMKFTPTQVASTQRFGFSFLKDIAEYPSAGSGFTIVFNTHAPTSDIMLYDSSTMQGSIEGVEIGNHAIIESVEFDLNKQITIKTEKVADNAIKFTVSSGADSVTRTIPAAFFASKELDTANMVLMLNPADSGYAGGGNTDIEYIVDEINEPNTAAYLSAAATVEAKEAVASYRTAVETAAELNSYSEFEAILAARNAVQVQDLRARDRSEAESDMAAADTQLVPKSDAVVKAKLDELVAVYEAALAEISVLDNVTAERIDEAKVAQTAIHVEENRLLLNFVTSENADKITAAIAALDLIITRAEVQLQVKAYEDGALDLSTPELILAAKELKKDIDTEALALLIESDRQAFQARIDAVDEAIDTAETEIVNDVQRVLVENYETLANGSLETEENIDAALAARAKVHLQAPGMDPEVVEALQAKMNAADGKVDAATVAIIEKTLSAYEKAVEGTIDTTDKLSLAKEAKAAVPSFNKLIDKTKVEAMQARVDAADKKLQASKLFYYNSMNYTASVTENGIVTTGNAGNENYFAFTKKQNIDGLEVVFDVTKLGYLWQGAGDVKSNVVVLSILNQPSGIKDDFQGFTIYLWGNSNGGADVKVYGQRQDSNMLASGSIAYSEGMQITIKINNNTKVGYYEILVNELKLLVLYDDIEFGGEGQGELAGGEIFTDGAYVTFHAYADKIEEASELSNTLTIKKVGEDVYGEIDDPNERPEPDPSDKPSPSVKPDETSGKGLPGWAIALIVVGAAVVAGGAVVFIIFMRKKRS